jgi:hypothetical protein
MVIYPLEWRRHAEMRSRCPAPPEGQLNGVSSVAELHSLQGGD